MASCEVSVYLLFKIPQQCFWYDDIFFINCKISNWRKSVKVKSQDGKMAQYRKTSG